MAGAPPPPFIFNMVAQWRFEAKMLASFYHFRWPLVLSRKANLHTTLMLRHQFVPHSCSVYELVCCRERAGQARV